MSAQPNQFLFQQTSSFIAVWPGDEAEIVLGFNGEKIFFPGRGHAYTAQDRVRHRFLSAIDPHSGKAIPGTVVIEDIWGKDEESGEEKLVLDATSLLKGMFGPQGVHQGYARRGLRIVQSVDQIGEAMAAGREQWEEAYIDAAVNTLREEQLRQNKWEKIGVMPPPASPDVRKADEFLKRIASRRKADLSAGDIQKTLNHVLGIAQAPVMGVVQNVPASELPPEPPEEEQPLTADMLMDAADEVGIKLGTAELRGLVAWDPAIVDAVQKKILAAEAKRQAEAGA